jgi:hypothetical protein
MVPYFTLTLNEHCLPEIGEGMHSVFHWLHATVGLSCYWLMIQFTVGHVMKTEFMRSESLQV